MELRFLGPLNQVTGSCYWLRDSRLGLSFLVDCGIAQGDPMPAYVDAFPFNPASLDFVLLTHAHQDHCGLLAALAAQGFIGVVYCTEETEALTRINLEGARDSEHASKLNFRRIGNGALCTHHRMHQDLHVAAYPSGHIIGAVSYRLAWRGVRGPRSLVFSGDLGAMAGRRSFALTRPPVRPPVSDYVVMESTYGDRPRRGGPAHLTRLMGELAELIDRVKRQRGVLLIPTFSIERTHTLQMILDELYQCDEAVRDVPLYVHSPSARRMGDAYVSAWQGPWLDGRAASQLSADRCAGMRLRGLYDDRATAQHSALNLSSQYAQRVVGRAAPVLAHDSAPAVVLASGGMMTGGTIQQYLPTLLKRSTTIIALTSHVGDATTGGWVRAISQTRAGGATIDGGTFPKPEACKLDIRADEIHAEVAQLDGYSGHADQRSLVDWVCGKAPLAKRRIFLTHGSRKARTALKAAIASRLGDLQLRVQRPSRHSQWFDLDWGGATPNTVRTPLFTSC